MVERRFTRWLIDLKYYKTKIGVKKWQPRYLICTYRCQKCDTVFTHPNLPIITSTRFGYGLMAWCVYHNIVGKQSMLGVHRGLQDIFNLNVGTANMYRFRSTLAKFYLGLNDEILAAILKMAVVHIDETPVKLRKTTGYVWVVSSSTEVCYIFRDTREGSFVHDLLGAYEGVLVSDFFTAYDSLDCQQQKTFLHYDGVPWNNNNAEHAVHHFAKLRQLTDGMFTRESLQQLLVLLTVIQTCEYRKVNPLRFLLSGERQLRGISDLGYSQGEGPIATESTPAESHI